MGRTIGEPIFPAPPRWVESRVSVGVGDWGLVGVEGTYAGGVCAIALVAVGAFADDLAINVSVLRCLVCVACATGSDILGGVVADVSLT